MLSPAQSDLTNKWNHDRQPSLGCVLISTHEYTIPANNNIFLPGLISLRDIQHQPTCNP